MDDVHGAREAARGGISLPLPEQEIDVRGEHWTLSFRSQLPVEEWNAQISLLTGMAAASLMVYARVGILRTLPPADPRDVQRLLDGRHHPLGRLCYAASTMICMPASLAQDVGLGLGKVTARLASLTIPESAASGSTSAG